MNALTEPAARRDTGTIRVLLVEDDAGDRAWIEGVLRADGTDVPLELAPAGTLAAALEELGRSEVDIVLLDLSLPDAFGLQALVGLRTAHPEIPIVVFTGLDDDEFARDALRSGADDYLVKGQIDTRSLARCIPSALERRALRRELEQRISELEVARENLRTLIAENADGMVVVDPEGIIRFANPAAQTLLGRTADALVDAPFGLPLAGETEAEIELLAPGAPPRVVAMRTTEILWQGALARLASLRDITQQRRQMAALEEQAFRDALTGLYNRRAFEAMAEQQLALARRRRTPLLLFFMDLDNLKRVNDEGGHEAGDRALVVVARALAATFRTSDLVSRWGGDEFAALALDCPGVVGDLIIRRLSDSIRSYASGSAWPCELSLSTGTAIFDPRSSDSLEELVRRADEALYQRKHARRGP